MKYEKIILFYFLFVMIIHDVGICLHPYMYFDIDNLLNLFPFKSHTHMELPMLVHSLSFHCGTFLIRVIHNRASCRLHIDQKALTVTSYVVVVFTYVGVIHVRTFACLATVDHCYIMLGTIEFVDISVNDNSACRLDHCDVIGFV